MQLTAYYPAKVNNQATNLKVTLPALMTDVTKKITLFIAILTCIVLAVNL